MGVLALGAAPADVPDPTAGLPTTTVNTPGRAGHRRSEPPDVRLPERGLHRTGDDGVVSHDRR